MIKFILSILTISSLLLFTACGSSGDGNNYTPTIETTFLNFSLPKNSGTNSYGVNISDIYGDELTLSIESNNTNILTVSKNFTNPLFQADYKNQTLSFNITTVKDAIGIVKITITVDDNGENSTKSFNINVIDAFQSGDIWKKLIYKTITSSAYTKDIKVIINGITKTYKAGTKRVWLDRNLGASQACIDYNDTACYGDYYQWGRNTDGHEKNTSRAIPTLATDINVTTQQNIVDNNGSFITTNTSTNDWVASGIDDNGSIRSANWSKIDGSSVCPVGYRVPTIDEFSAENIIDKYDAYSKLKLPSAGYRYRDSTLSDKSNSGHFWSSSLDDVSDDIKYFGFGSNGAGFGSNSRATGLSVRCVRDYSPQ